MRVKFPPPKKKQTQNKQTKKKQVSNPGTLAKDQYQNKAQNTDLGSLFPDTQ